MLNRAEIIGHLGADPEMRQTQSGEAVANLSVATSERWKDKQGQRQERTEWHKVSAFGKLAEIMGQYLSKGSLVFIAGRIQTRKWQDNSGQDRRTTEIIANEMKMLGGRGDAKPQQQQQSASSDDALDDEIPF